MSINLGGIANNEGLIIFISFEIIGPIVVYLKREFCSCIR